VPPSRWSYLDQPEPLAFAHRGGAEDAPENTMRAFEHAVRLGYRYLETDAHLTADGVLVAFHDDVLDRVTDRAGRIGDLAWAEVAEARVAGGEAIPLLEDLLLAFPQARINIDPKHDDAVEPLAALLTKLDAIDRVGIGSFSSARLARMRRLCGPRLCTSIGPAEILRLRYGGFGRYAAGCVQVPVRWGRMQIVNRRLLDACHRRGMQVHVWTINEPDEMHRLLDLGVDGLMTDRPAALKQVLVARGQWPTA